MDKILKLFPQPTEEIPFIGAYLSHDLIRQAAENGRPFVYANFISSLDGRIAIPRQGGEGLTVPKATANERDWRLFQELTAQADIILSSGRYLREWVQGKAQEILQVDDPRFVDLLEWRRQRGLRDYPDIAILSSSLDFEIPEMLTAHGRKAIVITDEKADPRRVKEIEAKVGSVIAAGKDGVEGSSLYSNLAQLGYRTVYSSAGPKVLHLLAVDKVLDRLYLTIANKMLGGKPYSTIIDGPLLSPPAEMRLSHVYYDDFGLEGLGQLFTSYDRADQRN
jgi:riboflavin biosynthesis pyrimidine reductase